MALEDVMIIIEFFQQGGKRGLNFFLIELAFVNIVNHYVVFLRLRIEQIVEGKLHVISSDPVIVDGYLNSFLLLSGFVQQRVQLSTHISLV